jgi:hypothetical protein
VTAILHLSLILECARSAVRSTTNTGVYFPFSELPSPKKTELKGFGDGSVVVTFLCFLLAIFF